MESEQIDIKTKRELQKIYENSNPALLKREIDKNLSLLYKAYKTKNGKQMVEPAVKKLTPSIEDSLGVIVK
jgi:hypothetical protein